MAPRKKSALVEAAEKLSGVVAPIVQPKDAPWPAESVEMVALTDLVPYARNSRTHSPEQIEALAAAMLTRWGFTVPILRDEVGGIIAGHGRVMAAELNFKRGHLRFARVPAMTARGWSEEEKRAYVIWDNKSALLADWDESLLRVELSDLRGSGFDLALTGFSVSEVSTLFAPPRGSPDLEETPAEPKVPVSRPGDLWVLGDHRLVCGDSTRADVVERVLGGRKPHLMVTDPPYGVDYDPNWRNVAERPDGSKYGASAVGVVSNDTRADWREAWALFPGEVAYVWHGGLHGGTVEESLKASGFELRAQIIWRKSGLIIGRGHYHWQHEPCLYVVRKGGKGHWQGARDQSTVWDIDHRRSETGHGTQKPVEAMRRPIENNSEPGDFIYEPFSGSGTTIIAGQATGRKVLAVELEPTYVDVAVLRWMEFTGQEAFLDTGEAWTDVSAARLEEPPEAV